ncbi:MAG: DUF3365 domain-containing protein [Desulfomonile tiedjei]|nr:DUF3365 domain-containing protein [Desulfomonile tiedjei]
MNGNKPLELGKIPPSGRAWMSSTMFDRLKSSFGHRISFKFIITSALATLVIFLLAFAWFSGKQEQHIMDQVRKQAVILHQQLVLTRRWVADNKWVLVAKTPEMRSSPFLEEPEVKDADGRVYTKVLPSIMTKVLSDRALRDGLYSFKLVDANPLNPENSPDAVEAEALASFRSGDNQGLFKTEGKNGKAVLRYVAPLFIDESCLQCHMAQGFKPGDVGGALSIFIPMDEARSAINRNRIILVIGGVSLACSLVLSLFVATRSIVFKRIGEIRTAMNRLTSKEPAAAEAATGDELKEIADICYLLDERMKSQHLELERKIAEATRDLSATNRNLEAANEELRRLNKARADFFSDISHELRTPLTNIKGAVDLLDRKLSCQDPTYLDIVRRNTDHLIKVVVDFLDFSRIESGQLDLNLTSESLKTIAEDAIFSLRPEAERKSVALALEADADPPLLLDRQRTYQVLTNLFSNAVRYAPEYSTVRIDVRATPDSVEVSVKDEGPGIDRQYHTSIFEKFYQVPGGSDATLHRGSSGIGLAICKGLVEAHGGRIWVTSEPGKGARFTFSLPRRLDDAC